MTLVSPLYALCIIGILYRPNVLFGLLKERVLACESIFRILRVSGRGRPTSTTFADSVPLNEFGCEVNPKVILSLDNEEVNLPCFLAKILIILPITILLSFLKYISLLLHNKVRIWCFLHDLAAIHVHVWILPIVIIFSCKEAVILALVL